LKTRSRNDQCWIINARENQDLIDRNAFEWLGFVGVARG